MMKMPPKKKKKRTGGFEIVRLIFLLMLGLKLSDAQVRRVLLSVMDRDTLKPKAFKI